jgi:hypothetical protein
MAIFIIYWPILLTDCRPSEKITAPLPEVVVSKINKSRVKWALKICFTAAEAAQNICEASLAEWLKW